MIHFSITGTTATLRINRPQARNALNWEAQEQFAAAVRQVRADGQIRVLVITGSGDEAFVSGADLKELHDHPQPESGRRLHRIMSGALAELGALPIPVIGAVNGDAFGGGCEILTACDIRLARPSARFSFAQVRNGLTTGWGGTGRLVRLLGQSRAMELLLTGRLLSAAEAAAIGLVHSVVPDEAWEATLSKRASQLARLPRSALAATKQLVQAAPHCTLEELNALEEKLFVDLWPQPDHLEAMAAFIAKRSPRFNRDG